MKGRSKPEEAYLEWDNGSENDCEAGWIYLSAHYQENWPVAGAFLAIPTIAVTALLALTAAYLLIGIGPLGFLASLFDEDSELWKAAKTIGEIALRSLAHCAASLANLATLGLALPLAAKIFEPTFPIHQVEVW